MQLKITGEQLLRGIFVQNVPQATYLLNLTFFLQKTEILIFLNKKFSSESRRLMEHKNMGHTYVKKHSSAMVLGELINFSNLFKKHSRYDTYSEHMKTVVTTSQLLMF